LEEAASYCGVSGNTFRAHVRVHPRKIGAAIRYDRVEIDRWIDKTATHDPVDRPMTAEDWLKKLDDEN
jgi:predicted DNA-binding transcriptional regulator AlpA